MASTPGCSTRTVFSGPGGTRTHSIPGSKRGWSANCLPSQLSTSAPGAGVEPTLAGSKPAVLPLDDPGIADHLQMRKERESNPQGSSLGRFRDGCHRQLACPSVQAAAAGIEPAIVSLTGSRLTIGPHRKQIVGHVSNVPIPHGGLSLSHGQNEHPAGIEPAHPAWRAGRLPLHHGCKTLRSQVGPEGLEPSPRWLRARYAAANTWIPFGPEGVEPSSGPYKEPALAARLRATGAGGI